MMLVSGSESGRTLRPPPTVLVAASLAPDRSGIARAARELGYRAIEEADPFEVIRRLRHNPAVAQLLLVEVSLPGMDGGELVERARDAAPGLRAVFLSDDPDGRDAELIGAYPELAVLETPVDRRELTAVLRAALGRRRTAPAAPVIRQRRARPSGQQAGQ